MLKKYKFGKERCIKQINDIWECPGKTLSFHRLTEKYHVCIKFQ